MSILQELTTCIEFHVRRMQKTPAPYLSPKPSSSPTERAMHAQLRTLQGSQCASSRQGLTHHLPSCARPPVREPRGWMLAQLEKVERLGEEAWGGVAAVDRGAGDGTSLL